MGPPVFPRAAVQVLNKTERRERDEGQICKFGLQNWDTILFCWAHFVGSSYFFSTDWAVSFCTKEKKS